MSSVISDDQFRHIAHLSRLPLKDSDAGIKAQLSQAADYIDILKELNTDTTPPTSQVNHKTNISRPDQIIPSLPVDLALSQAESTDRGYFKTTATIKK